VAEHGGGEQAGNRFRVSQWFAIASAILGLVTIVSMIAGALAIVRLTDARELMVERLDPAATAALRLSNALINEETGVRGYSLTGDESFLEPYRNGRIEERAAIGELRRLIAGAGLEEVRSDLRHVEARAATWRRRYALPAIRRVRVKGPGAVREAGVERGQRMFDAVRTALDRQQATIRVERAKGRQSLADAATFLSASFAAIAALVIAALITTTIMLRRTVTLPIGSLARRVRRVARGDFEHRVRSYGPRDIGNLAADIDSMRRRILQELEASHEAHERLDAQASELERSNAELEQFAYVASHDLQEPLRKVASFCQLLEQRYKGQLDDRADQYIAFAVDGAKRMQQLINDLLAFSRVGRTGADFERIDLDEVLGQALANLAAAIEESGATVESDPLPTVEGDPTLLTLVLQNLVGNAIKFRSQAAPEVHVGVKREDDHWLISCSDNGIGIDPEYAERVFVIFQRLHAKDEYAGTGIGLSMCRKIVEYHGGRIWLDDDTQSGTTFRFTLPAPEETDDHAATA
jgi:signal transduction histidine kinase